MAARFSTGRNWHGNMKRFENETNNIELKLKICFVRQLSRRPLLVVLPGKEHQLLNLKTCILQTFIIQCATEYIIYYYLLIHNQTRYYLHYLHTNIVNDIIMHFDVYSTFINIANLSTRGLWFFFD